MLRDQLILSPDSFGLIVHIGAGFCDELDTYLEAGADKIILIEPNPEAIAELSAKIQGHEKVELITAAISQTAGQAQLRVLNFADLSSLRMPTDLVDLLPGVRVVSEPMVDTLTFEELCKQFPEAPEGKSNWLIIEASGEELAITKALIESGNTKLFPNVMIRCGQNATFEGDSAAPEVLQVLRDGGYQLENSWIGEDPDWPYFYLHLDIQRLENTRLKAEAVKAKSYLSDLENKLLELQAANTLVQETSAATAQSLQEQIKAAQAETAASNRGTEATTAKLLDTQAKLDTKVKEHSATQEQAKAAQAATAAANHEKEATAAKLLDMQIKLDAKVKEHSATQEQTKAAQAATAAANHEKEATAAKLLDMQTVLNAKTKEHNAAQEKFKTQLHGQQETLKNDLSVALRLQMLARSDHQDLQARYGDLLDEKHLQEKLLIKLTQRLGDAAGYLRQLSDQGIEIDLPAEPLENTKPAPARRKKKSTPR